MGLTLIWGVMDVINLTHGAMVVAGMMALYLLVSALGVSPYLTLPPVLIGGFFVGVALYWIAIHRMVGRPPLMSLLSTFAVNLILIGVGTAVWGTALFNVEVSLPGVSIGRYTFPGAHIVAAVLAAVIAAALYMFLHWTRLGKALRAVANNREAAELVGIHIPQRPAAGRARENPCRCRRESRREVRPPANPRRRRGQRAKPPSVAPDAESPARRIQPRGPRGRDEIRRPCGSRCRSPASTMAFGWPCDRRNPRRSDPPSYDRFARPRTHGRRYIDRGPARSGPAPPSRPPDRRQGPLDRSSSLSPEPHASWAPGRLFANRADAPPCATR